MSRDPIPPRVPELRPGAPGGKRAANRLRRTRELCDAALALFLERGIEDVTIDQITRQAGTAKGSFYRYFKDKEELVQTLFLPLHERIREAFEACHQHLGDAADDAGVRRAYQALGLALAAALLPNRDLALLYLQESRGPAVGARVPVRALATEIASGALELTKVARARGLLRPFDARVSALVVIGAAERLLFEFLSGGDIGDPAELPGKVISLVMDGMRL